MKELLAAVLSRIGARAFGALCQAVLIIVLAREVGPAGFGALAFASSLCGIGGTLLGFGANSLGLRIAHYSAVRGAASGILTVGLGGAVVAAIGSGVIAASTTSRNHVVAALAGSLLAASEVANESLTAVLSGCGRANLASTLVVIRRGSVLALATGIGALSGLSLGTLCAAAISMMIPVWFLVKWGLPSMGEIKWCVLEGKGYWATSLTSQLTALDVTIVRVVLGAVAAGVYAAALRCVSFLNLVSSSLMGIMVPYVGRDLGVARRARERAMRTLAFLAGAGVSLLAPAVWALVPQVLGPTYSDARGIAVALTFAIGVSCVSQAFLTELLVAGRPRDATAAIGGGAAVGMVGCAGAAYAMGLDAVGPVIVLMETLIAGLLWTRTRKCR